MRILLKGSFFFLLLILVISKIWPNTYHETNCKIVIICGHFPFLRKWNEFKLYPVWIFQRSSEACGVERQWVLGSRLIVGQKWSCFSFWYLPLNSYFPRKQWILLCSAGVYFYDHTRYTPTVSLNLVNCIFKPKKIAWIPFGARK